MSLDKEDMLELGVVALGDRKRLQLVICELRDGEKENRYAGNDKRKEKRNTVTLVNDTPGRSLRLDESPLSSYNGQETQSDPGSFSEPEAFLCNEETRFDEEPEDSIPPYEPETPREGTGNSAVIPLQNSSQEIAESAANTTSNVPDYLEGWEEEFIVPTQFSERTMAVLTSGSMSKSARAEIIQSTVAIMLNHCKYPTAHQHSVVAKKIVTNLLHGKKDNTGTGFGSWTKGLETRFCNMRRKPRSPCTGLAFSPPAKRKKIGNHLCSQSCVLLNSETYDLHVNQIVKQWSKKTRSKAAVLSLMDETSTNRRKWIVEERPPISDVVEKFPTLQDFHMLLADFASVTLVKDPMKNFMDNWKIWIPKIFQKVKLEAEFHKKTYLPFLPILSECVDKSAEEICEHPDISVLLLCLRKLLNSRMPKDCTEFLIVLVDGVDIEERVKQIDVTAPYIVQVGPTITRQWFIAVEKDILLSVDNITNAVVAMMAYYYVFDIAYPKQWNSCLIFIAKYLLNLKGCPPLNATQLGVVSDIDNI